MREASRQSTTTLYTSTTLPGFSHLLITYTTVSLDATQTLVDTKAPSSAFVPHLHRYHAPRLCYPSKSIGFYHHSCTALYSLCGHKGLDFDNENGKAHRPSRFAAETFIDTKAAAELTTTRSALDPEAPVYTPRSVGNKKLESYLSRLILTALLRQ